MSTAQAKTKSVGQDLTSGPILTGLLAFAIPMILTNLIQQVYSMVDLMIIGKYVGSVGTVAVSTGGELSDIMTPVATSFATAGQIYIAQLVGARETSRVKETIGTLITMMMGISLIFMIGSILFNAQILTLLNCPEEAFTQAQAYMIITALGMPAIFGYNAVCGVLRGMGESKRPMYFIIVAAVINIVLDLLLVVVIPLEAAGTAIATALAQYGSFAAAFWYMYQRKEQFDFELKLSYFKVKKQPFFIIFKLGLPQLVRVCFVRFSMLWVNSNVNAYGLTASATNSVGTKLNKFLEVFIQGVDGAAGAMIGQNLGAKKTERARKITWETLGVTMVIGAVLIFLVLAFPRQLFGIFTTDAEVIEFGVIYLQTLAVGIFFSALIGPFNSMVTGCGFVSLGFFIGILDGMICRIGLSLMFLYVFDMGVLSYFWGTACCRILPCIICFIYFMSGRWAKRKLLSEQ